MRYALLVVGIFVVTACAHTKVANVDLGSCEDRGTLDGHHVGRCPIIEDLKK